MGKKNFYIKISALLVATLSLTSGQAFAATASNAVTISPAPVRVGVVRMVPELSLLKKSNWGPALDLALETEFWDLIGNSRHDIYPQWQKKVSTYTTLNTNASPKLRLLLSAGGVFDLSLAFERQDLGGFKLVNQIPQLLNASVTVGPSARKLRNSEPAQVFYHNNKAMLSLLLSNGDGRDKGICHLEQMRKLSELDPSFRTEGPAAAPFTYGMVNDIKWVDYGIALSEDCKTEICDWTSKEAPFKPIGMRMMLAELHQIRSTMLTDPVAKAFDLAKMKEHLDDAKALAVEYNYPYPHLIESLRNQLASRASYAPHKFPLMKDARFPMPVYANGKNCSGCHIGAVPAASGRSNTLAKKFPYADVTTQPPPPPSFLPANLDLSTCQL